MSFHRDNHYVARGYLKYFESSPGRVWVHRTLVSHRRVPSWVEKSIRGIAYRSHLYTRIVSGRETDEVERWLDREFESPAAEALEKVTSDSQLTPSDWRALVRYLAAQDVRTPSRYLEFRGQWESKLEPLVEETLKESIGRLEAAARSKEPVQLRKSDVGSADDADWLPVRVRTEIEQGEDHGEVNVEWVLGRAFWLFGIRRLLTKTLEVLHRHRWTILTPPGELRWFTSDNPVIRLNFFSQSNYDFRGGWGKRGGELLMPLSPRHLMYTRIGHRPVRRGSTMPFSQATLVRRLIAEHAHRMIIASTDDSDVLWFRPRIVDAEVLRHENEQWRRWNADQASAEREIGPLS